MPHCLFPGRHAARSTRGEAGRGVQGEVMRSTAMHSMAINSMTACNGLHAVAAVNAG